VAVRRLTKLLLFIVAVYGPLAPTMVLFMLVAAPLILLSGWPAWVQAVLLVVDIASVLAVAVLLGPGAIEEMRATMEEERRR
jgi:hypothetical protein